MATQLRIYTINRDRLGQFATEWKLKVLPLRIAHGFEIQRAWTIAQSNQFAWLISHPESGSWEDIERAYYTSVERSDMKPDPARLIARSEVFFVEDFL